MSEREKETAALRDRLDSLEAVAGQPTARDEGIWEGEAEEEFKLRGVVSVQQVQTVHTSEKGDSTGVSKALGSRWAQ